MLKKNSDDFNFLIRFGLKEIKIIGRLFLAGARVDMSKCGTRRRGTINETQKRFSWEEMWS